VSEPPRPEQRDQASTQSRASPGARARRGTRDRRSGSPLQPGRGQPAGGGPPWGTQPPARRPPARPPHPAQPPPHAAPRPPPCPRPHTCSGRRNACVIYVITYSLSCVTKHSPAYHVLMVGRVLGGIATSLLFSAFESWLVAEHFKRGYSGGWRVQGPPLMLPVRSGVHGRAARLEQPCLTQRLETSCTPVHARAHGQQGSAAGLSCWAV